MPVQIPFVPNFAQAKNLWYTVSTGLRGGAKMRIAICEDEKNVSDKLSNAIRDWAAAREIKTDILCYGNAENFLFVWPGISFDLAFLDIQMKNMSGLSLAESIRKTDQDLLLVFATSFSQYVLRGYDVDALHYLIKPVSPAKLYPILDKAYMIWQSRQSEALLVLGGEGQHKLPFNNIYYISMLAHYAEVHTIDEKYTLRKTAKELAESLPAHFARCHRSHIVNLFKVDCVYKEKLVLNNDIQLPVSRNSAKDVKAAFMRLHMGGTA
jgi:DNA-binding LytR/AlgR family response regulator